MNQDFGLSSPPMPPDWTPCCEGIVKANQSCTDNEGYGRLLHWYTGEGFNIGSELQPIRFCPWCGKPLPTE